MGTVYASVSDIVALGINLTAQQREAAQILLSTASAKLRLAAEKYGKNLDALIENSEDYGDAVKSIVIQAVTRALSSIENCAPSVTQNSETSGAYSISMTYLNAGQSLYFLKNELKELGLMRQTYGALDIFGTSNGEGG